MFYPIEGGSVYEVADNAFGFVFKCQLPPLGYGKNIATGKIEETDIFVRSGTPEEQFFERPKPSFDYHARRKHEKEIQRVDKYYVDQILEQYRIQEWGRRLRGVWVLHYNPITKESKYQYLTGLNYFYCTHWKFQGKYMDFRIPDMELFYVVSYCMEDPDCLGLNEITKRKNGKTARVGCWSYERTSRMMFHHAGLQSKTDTDAESAFLKAIIHPWQKLYDFFRPRYDLMKGSEPSILSFFPTQSRGSKVEMDDDNIEEPLESFMDYMPSSDGAYDGPELHTYVRDEAGKTKKPASIVEAQRVTRFCTEIDGVMKGKHWYTTTVEPETDKSGKTEDDNYEFQDLTVNSNPLERDDNNRTGTGLYTFFLPAQKGMMFEKYHPYGYPDEEGALRFINNTLKSYEDKGDTRGASSFKRKNPRTFKEAFTVDGEFSLYNPELLNGQLDKISWTNKWTERGNLEWEDGYRIKRPVARPDGSIDYIPNKINWIPNENGKFEKVAGWMPRQPNNVYHRGISYFPNNKLLRIGCDPFKYDKTKDKRRSNCAAFAYQIPDPIYKTDFDDMFVLRYARREESTGAANEDILMMSWWCGGEVLFERNINHWKEYFKLAECAGFLTWLPGEVEPGMITGTGSNGVQTICNYTEDYINKNIDNVYFKTLIRKDTGWLGFKVEDTEKFDEPMAAGITLVSVKGIVIAQTQGDNMVDVGNYFRMRSS